MQLQRWSGLSLVDAVCLSKDELIQVGKTFRVRTQRRKTGVTINNVIPGWLGRELLTVKKGNRTYFFISGEATPKGAVSVFDKMYRQVFKAAGIDGTSHAAPHLQRGATEGWGGHSQGKQGTGTHQRYDHRAVLREVEQGPAGHLGR
jgi:hypothetical protein